MTQEEWKIWTQDLLTAPSYTFLSRLNEAIGESDSSSPNELMVAFNHLRLAEALDEEECEWSFRYIILGHAWLLHFAYPGLCKAPQDFITCECGRVDVIECVPCSIWRKP